MFYILQTEQFAVLWLLFAVIVAGNTAVLAGLLLGKRRKSRMDFFIKQLAFAGKFFSALNNIKLYSRRNEVSSISHSDTLVTDLSDKLTDDYIRICHTRRRIVRIIIVSASYPQSALLKPPSSICAIHTS